VALWRSVVGKLWATIILLVLTVLIILGVFLLEYIDHTFTNSYEIKRLFIYTGVIGFLLTTFFAFFLSTRITRPLVNMKKAADLMSRGDYSARVKVVQNDEIGQLASTMNHLAEQLERTIQDLSLERDRLSGVLRSMTDAVITFDASGKVILANPQGRQLLAAWSVIDHWEDWEEAADVPKERIPEPLMSVYRIVLDTGKETSTKLHVGSGVWSVVMAPFNSRQTVQGAVAVLRDITEEFRLEKLRRDFVANVSHELRTPLAMLQGYSEALLDDIAATPEERNQIVQVIHDEAVRMSRLVQDLLDLAQMEAGRLSLSLGTVDVRALLERMERKYAVLCKERHIGLKLQVADDAPILQKADEDRIEQVLTNLLDNAIRHSPEGSEISLSAELAEWKEEPALRLVVADRGSGIPEQDLPYIFERFYKADKSRKRGAGGGTGLGLAIVKNIVEAHRGHIEAASKVNVGTTFTVLLPVN